MVVTTLHKHHRIPLSGVFCFILALLSSCTGKLEVESGDKIAVSATAHITCDTRTSLNGVKLSWVESDGMGVFIDGVQNNASFLYHSSKFDGFFCRTGAVPSERSVYAYYPLNVYHLSSDTKITGNLPTVQNAPFHAKADYMVADKGSIYYDEENLPAINITFNRHLFSILKINVTNSDESLKDEKLMGIRIKSRTKILSGTFTFDVSDGASAVAVFSEDTQLTHKYIDLNYGSGTALGKDKAFTLYAIVPVGTYAAKDISLTVYTENLQGTVVANREMTLANGTIYDLQKIDFAKLTKTAAKKTVLCFGDSITTGTVTGTLQSLLGNDWKVYIAGVSGEKVLQIMSRQGAAPLYLAGGFIIPASSSQSVAVGTTFYSRHHTDGEIADKPDTPIMVNLQAYSGNATYCGVTNPFMVKGVECSISSNGGTLYLQRSTDGEAVDCSSEEFVQAVPYAFWKLGNPDVTTVYMGTNGVYTSNTKKGRTRDEVLTDFYEMVRSNTTGEFIAIGYHHSSWTESYAATMTSAFGNHYLDLRTVGWQNAETIAKQVGEGLTAQDYENISKKNLAGKLGRPRHSSE